MKENEQYKSLIESLRLLALDQKEQLEVLPGYTCATDEIISTFCDAFLLLPQIIERDFISRQAIASIVRCFNWIDLLSRQENLHNIEALDTHEYWSKARGFARKALEDMHVKVEIPDLSYIKWIDD